MCDGWPAGPAPSGMLSRCSRTSEHDDVARVAGFGLAQPWPTRFQVFTTGRACFILALAGSECVVRVLIEADIDAEIGARLAELRRRCGLTQRQLAKAVGVQLTTVQNWERGRTGLPALASSRAAPRRFRRRLKATLPCRPSRPRPRRTAPGNRRSHRSSSSRNP